MTNLVDFGLVFVCAWMCVCVCGFNKQRIYCDITVHFGRSEQLERQTYFYFFRSFFERKHAGSNNRFDSTRWHLIHLPYKYSA